MKTNCYIYMVALQLIAGVKIGHAQSTYKSKNGRPKKEETKEAPKEEKSYTTMFFSANALFTSNPKGTLDIKFPYASKNVTNGSVSYYNSHSSIRNPMSKVVGMFDVSSYELGGPGFFFSERIGLLSMSEITDFYLSIGLGHNFYFHSGGYENKQNRFILKPSLNVLFYNLTEPLATFDNYNKEIDVLGYTAGTSFQTSGKYSHVETSKNLTAGFNQYGTMLVTQLSLTNNPIYRKGHLGINLAWFFPLHEKGGVSFDQTGVNNGSANLATVDYDTSNLTAIFRASLIHRNPFSMGGFQIGMTFGLNSVHTSRTYEKKPEHKETKTLAAL